MDEDQLRDQAGERQQRAEAREARALERKEQAELKPRQAADLSSTERHEREAQIHAHAADVQRPGRGTPGRPRARAPRLTRGAPSGIAGVL